MAPGEGGSMLRVVACACAEAHDGNARDSQRGGEGIGGGVHQETIN